MAEFVEDKDAIIQSLREQLAQKEKERAAAVERAMLAEQKLKLTKGHVESIIERADTATRIARGIISEIENLKGKAS
jgi:hypothetical protein